jgi:hypothetical protein
MKKMYPLRQRVGNWLLVCNQWSTHSWGVVCNHSGTTDKDTSSINDSALSVLEDESSFVKPEKVSTRSSMKRQKQQGPKGNGKVRILALVLFLSSPIRILREPPAHDQLKIVFVLI